MPLAQPLTSVSSHPRGKMNQTLFMACLLLLPLCILAFIHLRIGARHLAFPTIMDAFLHFNARNFDHQTLMQLRMPRLLGAMLTGSALGIAGAILQALSRNPLAEPHILGLNAGASLAMVLASSLSASIAASVFIMPVIASAGGGFLFLIILLVASAGRIGLTPFKLIFSGVALSGLASSLCTGVLILDEETIQTFRHWLAGDLSGLHYALILAACPPIACGILLSLVIAPSIEALAFGDQAARGLGVSLQTSRILAMMALALLCGGAVTLAGPIGFIGLIAPQAIRCIIDCRLRLKLLLSGLTGACLLTAADCIARTLAEPHELATGSVTALIGAPLFIWLAARSSR